MAIPSRSQTFALEDCRDLLRKLEWELAGLKAERSADLDALAFRTFNTAVTAWHLSDWVYESMTSDQRHEIEAEWGLPEDNRAAFQNAVRERCRALAVCRAVATASKHVEVTRGLDASISTTASAATSSVIAGIGDAVVDEKGDRVTVISWRLKVEDGGRWRPFLEVAEEALIFWTGFICPRHIGR